MRRIVLVATITFALACAACAEESTSKDRSNVNNTGTDAATNEGGTTTDGGKADPDDGRDTEPASCYAACSNTSFTCESVVANLSPDSAGCTGTIGPPGGATQTLKLDCGAKKVCVESSCVDGRYSATTFAFPGAGGAQVVCTRD